MIMLNQPSFHENKLRSIAILGCERLLGQRRKMACYPKVIPVYRVAFVTNNLEWRKPPQKSTKLIPWTSWCVTCDGKQAYMILAWRNHWLWCWREGQATPPRMPLVIVWWNFNGRLVELMSLDISNGGRPTELFPESISQLP